jgi:histidinol dehydrogenase
VSGASALQVKRLNSAEPGFAASLDVALHWSAETDDAVEQAVAAILADVRQRGDQALLEYSARFDHVHAPAVSALEIPASELQAALLSLAPARRDALQAAAERVRQYHLRQRDASARGWTYRDAEGSLLGQKVTPLDRVGIYVPGGKAAYPSSVLMNAVPAKVAGVGEVVMVVPTPRGGRNPLVLAAAAVVGVDRVFTLGGAQAVAALAYGTATVPRVDKITGPGNAYVAAAKRRVFGQVGIDMIAGPSEILVIADGSTPPDWVAMDLFSQAEHDELAQSILLSPDASYLDAVLAAMQRLLPSMPRAEVIRASLQGRGLLIQTQSLEEACAISNRIAPEHLEVSSLQPRRLEPLLKHAGAIFLGRYTSESLGDYCAGPNHVLPTSGTARFSSPLGVYDFCKRSSLIEVSEAAAQVLGPIAAELADGEGLPAHAQAARLRLRSAAPTGVSASGAPPSSAAPGSGFEVRRLHADNLIPLMRLQVRPDQADFVAPVAKSIAQAAYEPLGRPYGLYMDEVPVGFLLLFESYLDQSDPCDELYVWRLMIDANHQRKGHGRLAMAWVVEEARRLGVAQVGLSHVLGNDDARSFYASLGFVATGKVKEGEAEMVFALKETAP